LFLLVRFFFNDITLCEGLNSNNDKDQKGTNEHLEELNAAKYKLVAELFSDTATFQSLADGMILLQHSPI